MRPTLTADSINIDDPAFRRVELAALRAWAYKMPLADISARFLRLNEASSAALVRRALSLLHQHGKTNDAYFLRNAQQFTTDKDLLAVRMALLQVEDLGQSPPALHHPIEIWFIRCISAKLEESNIRTIQEMIDTMNRRGEAWWREVPGLGKKGGLALIGWVRKNQQHFRIQLKAFIKAPTLPQLTDKNSVLISPQAPNLAPLERIRIATELSGEKGRNRQDISKCRLDAPNDYAAILTWLSLYPENSHTYRAYRKEAERFLLWCIQAAGKAMSDVYVEDVIRYRDFLKDPQPRFTWVGPTTKRFSDDWRPFQGPLAYTSAAHTITILKTMFEWLVNQGYLSSNPFSALPKNNRPARIAVEKALSIPAWQAVYEWGLTQKENPTIVTALAFLVLMRDSGLRRTEVAHLKRSDLVFNGGWQATFEGKGARYRTVPVSTAAIQAIERHLKIREKTLETLAPDAPLIAPSNYLKGNAYLKEENFGYTEQGLWRIVKAFFKSYTAANGFFEGRDLSSVTPHALRHTFGVNAIEKGVPIDVVQQTLGHTSLATTTIYSQGDIKRRARELAKLHRN